VFERIRLNFLNSYHPDQMLSLAEVSAEKSITVQTVPFSAQFSQHRCTRMFSGNNTNFGGSRAPQRKGSFQIGQPIPSQWQHGRQF
jgi:hypothetical protein